MQENDTRPDPEVLLARLKEEEQEEGGRGKLRIYLGYAAGVGKTYTMLQEAIDHLKEHGFIISGDGYDVASDEKTHTGRGVNVLFMKY